MRFLISFTKYRKSLLHVSYIFFSARKRIDFCKKITSVGDVIIFLVSEMPVLVFAVGKHFPLKIPFPRCDMRHNQQLWCLSERRLWDFIYFSSRIFSKRDRERKREKKGERKMGNARQWEFTRNHLDSSGAIRVDAYELLAYFHHNEARKKEQAPKSFISSTYSSHDPRRLLAI